jgi:uncharacterized protein
MSLKLHAERIEGTNAIARHGAAGVVVNGVTHTANVVVPWRGLVSPWSAQGFELLSAEHFAELAAHEPELIIFGSGSRFRFPPAACLRPLIDKRIGIETMDTAAACRTYNVLLGEGRAVLAALLFEG